MDVFFNSQCPWSGWMVDKIKRNIKEYGVIVNAINTDDRKVIKEYGMSRGVFVNGVPIVKRMASWKEIESIIKSSNTSLKPFLKKQEIGSKKTSKI